MDTQYSASAELLADISRRYPALATLDRNNVVMHREVFSRKTCPGFKVDLEHLIARANEMKSAPPATVPVGAGGGAAARAQPAPSSIRIVCAVRVRIGEPATTAPFLRILPPSNDPITWLAIVEEGQNVGGISRWYRIGENEFIRAGATVAAS